MPFSTAGMKFLGIDPPKMSSTNLKSEPARQGLQADPAVAELAVAARLLLVAPVGLGRGLDRLPVGDLRLLEVDLDLVALAQARDHHLDVELAHAREQHLVGLRVARDAQDRVLLEQPLERGRDLVVVAARLRLDGEGGGGLREHDRRVDDRARLVGERVAGLRVLELRHRADVAGLDLRDLGLGLALQQQERAHALGGVAAHVVDGGVGLQRAGVDAEEGDAPGVRVHDRLEHEGRERRVRGGPAGRLRLRGGVDARRPRRGPRARAAGRRSRRGRRGRRRCRIDEAGSTGKTLPAATAWRSPFASCSWESVPFSKNSSMSSSLLSATISTSFSRQDFAGSCWAAGTSVDLELPARVVAVDAGPSRTRGRRCP